jgi:hypothetical protein
MVEEFARNRTRYPMLTLYNYNHYATSIFVEILLLPKLKYMTKTFFLKPQPP